MGWSWALYFCRATTAAAGGADSVVVQDRHVAPTPTPTCAVRLPYVDSANVIGLTRGSTQRALEAVKDDLRATNLDYHEENLAAQELQLLGVIFDGKKRQ
eukprot:9480892-Pyramimonas_sp.AAC.1